MRPDRSMVQKQARGDLLVVIPAAAIEAISRSWGLRTPAETQPLIFAMESQHQGLAEALDLLEVKAIELRTTTRIRERDALVNAATDLLPPAWQE
jgi:hypothetical protein